MSECIKKASRVWLILSFAMLTVSVCAGLSCQPDVDKTSSGPAADESGFVSIFNGKDLAGWSGDTNVWRVEDGSIVGGSLTELLEQSQWLYTDREYGNFELHFEVKLIGDMEKNSGLWYRAKPFVLEEEDEVFLVIAGYESDIFKDSEDNRNHWGTLHDSYRREELSVMGEPSKIDKSYKPDGWNNLVIRCVGNHLEHWVNGYKTVDYIDRDEIAPLSGKIAVQVHDGSKMKVFFRNMKIKVLE